MSEWDQIEPSIQETILWHLNRLIQTHRDMIQQASETPVGPLHAVIERHQAMIDATIAAMKFLTDRTAPEWDAIGPVQKDFVIAHLLGFRDWALDHQKYALEKGLNHGGQRLVDTANATTIAAVALGWVNPVKRGSWDIVSRAVEGVAATIITAQWLQSEKPNPIDTAD